MTNHSREFHLQSIVPDVDALEDGLSRPTDAVVETCRKMEGDVIILGVGGKMGPSLARMIRRACDLAGVKRRVIGVSRFGSGDLEAQLKSWGVDTIACDLLDEAALHALPEVPNVLYMAGMKFGATGNEARTWAMNTYLPTLVCRKFRHSKIVAFSTGNIYGLTHAANGGSKETDAAMPLGEYAMSCLGRERMFEYFSEAAKLPVALIRLNYACDLRYGVMVDIARKIAAGQAVDISMGYFNTIWQGDANAMTVLAFDHTSSPATILNLTGPETLCIRDVAESLGKRMGLPVQLEGKESETAFLSNASKTLKLCGPPTVGADLLIDWVADWVKRGGHNLNKETHFEVRDGVY